MTPEKAQEMMAEAIKAMLDCGLFKAAQTYAIRTQVAGQTVDVTCLFFGTSADVLKVVAERASDPSTHVSINDDLSLFRADSSADEEDLLRQVANLGRGYDIQIAGVSQAAKSE